MNDLGDRGGSEDVEHDEYDMPTETTKPMLQGSVQIMAACFTS